MFVFFLILHLLICIGLIGVVLIQSGKGGGLAGGAFGGSAQTVFGGRGATDFITRATMVLGGAFFVTSIVLAMLSTRGDQMPRSIIQREVGRQQQQPPQPGAPASPQGRPATGSSAPAPSGGTAPAPSGGTAPAPSGAPASPPPPPGGGGH